VVRKRLSRGDRQMQTEAVPIASRSGAVSVAWAGLVALAVALGIGRFAFTPVLPMMLHDRTVTLAEGGWLASANYSGYLVGALATVWIKAAPKVMIRGGLLLTVALTAGMGLTQNLPLWLLLRCLSGMASAWILVYASAWGLQRLAQLQRPGLSGVVFCGVGVGILVTGLLCLLLVRAGMPSSGVWMLLGGLALALSATAWNEWDGESLTPPRPIASSGQKRLRWDHSTVILTLCYGLFGFGYIIPATFLPVIARQTVHSVLVSSLFWPLFGTAAALSTLLASSLAQRFPDRAILAISYLLQAAGVGILALRPTGPGIAISALLIGGTFMVMTMFGLREAQRVATHQSGTLMGMMTAAFAVGQILGPAYATLLVRLSGGFSWSLATAAVLLAVSALLLWKDKTTVTPSG